MTSYFYYHTLYSIRNIVKYLSVFVQFLFFIIFSSLLLLSMIYLSLLSYPMHKFIFRNSLPINKPKYTISVYEGISPSLLATMSLSQGIKGSTHSELITSLVKNNIIRNKALQSVLRMYDRKCFIDEKLNRDRKGNYYQNRPYMISGGQNMTDIFTHAVILEQVACHLEEMAALHYQKQIKNLKILDIGTGHGYLAFVVSSLVSAMVSNNLYIKPEIHAIDSNLPAVEYCKKLQIKFNQQQVSSPTDIQSIKFEVQELENVIKGNERYDIIIGGFYMPPSLHQKLMNKISQHDNQFGIWATDSHSGQSLYSFSPNKKKSKEGKIQVKANQIMSTMFSMPNVKTSVSKYFIQSHEQPQDDPTPQTNQKQVEEHLKKSREAETKKEVQNLKIKIKQECEKQNKIAKKKLSLEQLRKIPHINQLLQQLKEKSSKKRR